MLAMESLLMVFSLFVGKSSPSQTIFPVGLQGPYHFRSSNTRLYDAQWLLRDDVFVCFYSTVDTCTLEESERKLVAGL